MTSTLPARITEPPPGSTSSLRTANQHRVIAMLQESWDHSAVSQAEIARATRLAPATVSNIVRDLVSAGLIESARGSGRRGGDVRFARGAGLIAGIYIGHRHLRVVVADLGGRIIGESVRPLAQLHEHGEALVTIAFMLDELLHSADATRDAVWSIGLGLAAPIGNDGVVASSSILPGWVGVDAREVAASHLSRPVHLDNDANLGALAEHRRGAGIGHACMAYLVVSSGVGAGLIIDGAPFRGGAGTAGELGHLTVDENGPFCRCGNRGCLEAYTSTGMVQHMLRSQDEEFDIAAVIAAARNGDVPAIRVFEDAGRHLGWGVATLANLINPTCLVVGGDMARAGDLLLNPLRDGLRRHALRDVANTLKITTPALGGRSTVVGALLLALERTDLTSVVV